MYTVQILYMEILTAVDMHGQVNLVKENLLVVMGFKHWTIIQTETPTQYNSSKNRMRQKKWEV